MTREEFYEALKNAKTEHEKVLVAMDYNQEAEKIFYNHLPKSFKEERKRKYTEMLELFLYDFCIAEVQDPVGFDQAYIYQEDFMNYVIDEKKVTDTGVRLAMTVINRLYQYLYEETGDVAYRKTHSRTVRIAHAYSFYWQLLSEKNKTPKKRR